MPEGTGWGTEEYPGESSRSLRISFVVSELRQSGGVRVVAEYASRLAQRGHQVSLVTSAQDETSTVPVGDAVTVLSVPNRLDRRGSMRNLRLALALALRVPPGDVIVATHTPTVPIGLFAARILRRGRAVWLCQDYPEMFAGRPVQDWIFRHGAAWFDLVLCVSASVAADLPRPLRSRPLAVAVVGEGLSDTPLYRPSSPALRSPREVLYVGDGRPRKGLDDVLAALALVRERVPDVSLVAASREDLGPKLGSKVPVPVRFHYHPDQRDLARLYATCGVFVSASWAEGFGLPPLEAMACGAPVVASDSRGIREFARHEVNCLVVPPRDPSALADAIARLLLDRPLAERLGSAGVETAAEFGWEQAADRLERALLESVPQRVV